MSQGTLYADQKIRGAVPKAIIKAYNLDVKVAELDATFEKLFPLKKVPAFVGPKGLKLTEIIAVSLYQTKLLGKNATQYAEILRWLSLSNSEILPTTVNAFGPITGRLPYNKKQVDEANAYLEKVNSIVEARLAEYTYLVGERITLADYFVAAQYVRGFNYLFGTQWRKQHPGITRWFKTITAQPFLKDVLGEIELIDKPVEYTPPKKEKKAAAPAAKKEKPAAAAAEAAPAQQAPKPKHPLEALGKPTSPLDEWKRTYSNEETREVAIPFFWDKFYNAEEWSLWKVDYKYNDELTLTFMSNNLVGGFFARLSASTKYIFGSMVVYGENNDNGITGVFLVRGQEHEPAFDVAPDWESYSFTKLDASKEEDKAFVENMLAWDHPVDVNGTKREIADGKVFK
ncbi:hypothetical protein FT663_00894 [Candidozyma haemuli var. vulneris]|nr:hypothetical protein FT662_00698 [[Candida] haemuloni var. vulneris]KAF3994920.1 hypothetical protein FT663_00894 [[Candida] haemuloni var. vulneris]